MNIICSVGFGEMPVEACLKCAASHDRPPCGFDYALLKAMYASNQSSERASKIHVTDLTGCSRKAYLDKREPAAERPHEMLVRWLGSGMHGMVEDKDDLFDSELPVVHDGIVGRSDIVYKDGRLVDLKFTRWMYVNKLPYGSHALQVNIYGWMLRQMGRKIDRLQIQYIDASGPTKCRKCSLPVRMIDDELKCPKCFNAPKGAHLGVYLMDVPVLTDEEVKYHIQARKDNLEAALAMGMPPEREPGFLCNYCSHYSACQPELME
jgi:CRISPR/Cas system-associated exonuclease Cas4 (RecB family)